MSEMAGMKAQVAKQALVRFLADSQLVPGDKLPSQNELRLKLKVGTTTIASAINSLAEDGVLEIRDKVGVFVKDIGLDGHSGRNIAILVNISNSIYVHILVSQLQKELQAQNCHNIVFSCPGDKDSKKLKNYPGLLRNIRQNHISGMLITCVLLDNEYEYLDSTGIKYVSTINLPHGRNNCYYDSASFLKAAFKSIVEQGAKRPAVISRGYELCTSSSSAFSRLLKQLNPELDPDKYRLLTHSFSHSRQIVEELLRQSDDERPDALIFNGDVVFQGISGWLYRLQADKQKKYLPKSAVVLNKQNPVMPALEDLTVFELDIYELAAKSVNVLLEAVRNDSKITSHKVHAKRVSLEKYFENSIAPEIIED